MKGRKPKPAGMKLIEGNPGKKRIRREPAPPESGVPSPPPQLDAYGVEEWCRVADGLHAMGVLTGIDQQTLAAYCGAYSRWRHAEEELNKIKAEKSELNAMILQTVSGNYIQQPLIGIANKAAHDMMRYAAEFGLTPSARARLAIEPSHKADKFDGLIGVIKNG